MKAHRDECDDTQRQRMLAEQRSLRDVEDDADDPRRANLQVRGSCIAQKITSIASQSGRNASIAIGQRHHREHQSDQEG